MRARPTFFCGLFIVALSTTGTRAQGIEVNGGFEASTGLGWTEWRAPWSGATAFDFASTDDPFDGDSCLHLSADRSSFGVYQEFCLEPGVEIVVEWAWRGRSAGNGWWEVLIIDAPYSYEAADDPANHPETLVAAKWEQGFGGANPAPSPDWQTGLGELTTSSEVVTVVLKCGSSEGGDVEAWFDAVTVTLDGAAPEVLAIAPARGSPSGGTSVRVTGRQFGPDVEVFLGPNELAEALRLDTCEVTGRTPPGDPGPVDVIVRSGAGETRLVGGFTYVPDAPSFRRGDCDADGDTNVTDAIALLGFLFLGRPPPGCQEACNGDDDASLSVSDAIFVLNHLFGGGPPIPAPYPDCGIDPTPSTSCDNAHEC